MQNDDFKVLCYRVMWRTSFDGEWIKSDYPIFSKAKDFFIELRDESAPYECKLLCIMQYFEAL